MALLQLQCPKCRNHSLFDVNGGCVNTLGNGKTCGYKLPIRYTDGNSKFRSKVRKHTSPPPLKFFKDWSWTADITRYELFQSETLEHGEVKLDPENNYLFLWHARSGQTPIATLALSENSAVTLASGTIMPLNSKAQHLHHFYDNLRPHFVDIASGPDLKIEQPSPRHPDEYWVLRANEIVYQWNFQQPNSR